MDNFSIPSGLIAMLQTVDLTAIDEARTTLDQMPELSGIAKLMYNYNDDIANIARVAFGIGDGFIGIPGIGDQLAKGTADLYLTSIDLPQVYGFTGSNFIESIAVSSNYLSESVGQEFFPALSGSLIAALPDVMSNWVTNFEGITPFLDGLTFSELQQALAIFPQIYREIDIFEAEHQEIDKRAEITEKVPLPTLEQLLMPNLQPQYQVIASRIFTDIWVKSGHLKEARDRLITLYVIYKFLESLAKVIVK